MPLKDDNRNDSRNNNSNSKSSKTSLKSAIKKVNRLSQASRAFSSSRSSASVSQNNNDGAAAGNARQRSHSIAPSLENHGSSLLKSVLSQKSRSHSLGTNLLGSSASYEERESQFRFAPDVITSVREYCNQEPPNFLLVNPNQPLYEPINFQVNDDGKIIREQTEGSSTSTINLISCSQQDLNSNPSVNTISNDKDLLRKKVRLDVLRISKYHLNGFITCASLSLDQSCYIRVSCDNWKTFRESQAIEIGDFNINTPTQYQFDFLIPIDRNIDTELTGSVSSASKASRHEVPSVCSIGKGVKHTTSNVSNGIIVLSATELTADSSVRDEAWQDTLRRAPAKLELMVVLNGFRGLFYYDTNEGRKYSLGKKNILGKKKSSLKTVTHSD